MSSTNENKAWIYLQLGLALLPRPPEVLPPRREGEPAVQGDHGEDLSDEVHLLRLWQGFPHQQGSGASYGGGAQFPREHGAL